MMDNRKTILISGSGGLLGKELVQQLMNSKEFRVVAMTSQVDALKRQYKNSKHVYIVSNDSCFDELKEAKIKVDYFLNCAFPRSSKPEELAQGIPFTEQIIEKSIQYGIKNIINISSQSVYSQKKEHDATEETHVQPENLYGMTKFACERIVAILCKKHAVRYSNIRLASLTGPNFDVRMTNRFVKSVINQEKIIIYGKENKVSYLDVRDAGAALIQMLKMEVSSWKEVYNLGNNKSFSLLELVEEISAQSQVHGITECDIETHSSDKNYNNLIDSTRFYKDFQWEPSYLMTMMIEEQFNLKLNK